MIEAGRFRVGLGYRRHLHDDLLTAAPGLIDFIELAPENYLAMGGRWRRQLDLIRKRYPVVTHGLSLSLAGETPVPSAFLEDMAAFLEELKTPWHSDHLSWSSDQGIQSHELMPIPMTRSTVIRTSERVREVARALGKSMLVENVSAYERWPEDELDEADFVSEVVERSGANLLLDVNNVYVNAVNFGKDPMATLCRMPLESVMQIHIAGFERIEPDLVVDTHGEPVCEGVWALLREALLRTGPVPVLLERDHSFPPFEELSRELKRIRSIGNQLFGDVQEAGNDCPHEVWNHAVG
jgi:uncharacterized protein